MDSSIGKDFLDFLASLGRYISKKTFGFLFLLEENKSKFASTLYQKRGKYAKPFVHSGLVIIVVAGVTLGPKLIAEASPGVSEDIWESNISTPVLAASSESTFTFISEKPPSDVNEYEVSQNDTVSNIAEKFGVSIDTIIWENNLSSKNAKIKPGQILRILPVTGVLHQVKHGETVYSIAKKYSVSAQAIVDWPYNTFTNDETFALAAGQSLMIPDGIKPQEQPVQPRYLAKEIPGAGIATVTGQFVWPVGGSITQYFRAWHPGIDIANKGLPDVVAADGGTVTVAGWPTPWAYGNRVIIDHGNGFVTLYAHLSQIYVSSGQKVNKGQTIGKMGSTGRSTGPHLHYEIRKSGSNADPLSVLGK